MSNKTPLVSFVIIILVCAGLGALFWSQQFDSELNPLSSTPSPAPATRPIATPSPTPASKTEAEEEIQTATASPAPPTPSPIPLKDSDTSIRQSFSRLQHGKDLANMLTDEEIVRKIVRAVYGVSEGRVVREYRPINSPTGKFIADKIGKQTEDSKQELYRIAAANNARYADYIAIFSILNNDTSIDLYQFLSPTFEEAYQELGIGRGDFHTTLLSAIDVLIDAPSSNQAMLLIQPSVRFKFQDPELEKLSPAHKLMLRMGVENSEALKLELKAFRKRLKALK